MDEKESLNEKVEMMLLDMLREENGRLKQELTSLRQAIIQADPTVIMDGRFDQMITSPITIIDVARDLITGMRHH